MWLFFFLSKKEVTNTRFKRPYTKLNKTNSFKFNAVKKLQLFKRGGKRFRCSSNSDLTDGVHVNKLIKKSERVKMESPIGCFH